MAYEGVGGGRDSLWKRLLQHQNLNFRKGNPSFHYRVIELPRSVSKFRALALSGLSFGILVLSEGFMIASLGCTTMPCS
jgi:hypothetical protein